MRLREALRFVASTRGLRGDERGRAIGEAVSDAGLKGREHQLIGSLSRGYRQRVGLAMALLHRPPILVLDEPSSGLDPNQQIEMRRFLRRLGESRTVVFSSHILPEVEAVCDRLLIIHQGRLVADGTVEEICRQTAKDANVELPTLEEAFADLTDYAPLETLHGAEVDEVAPAEMGGDQDVV
jgi:ABC-2 type transport system ATP-binding protein